MEWVDAQRVCAEMRKVMVYDTIVEEAEQMSGELSACRRDLHKYAETGWFEVRTASKVARRLTDLGYEVLMGREVCLEDARMGVPSKEELERAYERAVRQGADPEFAPLLKDGFTGVIGILRCGEGPVVAMRFDMDALGVIEDTEITHRPAREGFGSVNPGCMHACGHDGHTAIGLGVAKLLMDLRESLHGTVKLIFQPAEEGVRGAKSIVEHGHLDDVDVFLGSHVTGMQEAQGEYDLIPGAGGSLATTKLDVTFRGKAAHAGGSPEEGNNVMLSIATAILNLYAIPRHSKGETRVNVGTVQAGSGRNVIADEGKMEIEVRGSSTEVNEYVETYARQILQAAAQMHRTACEITVMGGAYSLESDQPLMERIADVCRQRLHMKVDPKLRMKAGGSEDISYMMKRVQDHGGQAAFMRIMAETAGPGHSRQFDFDEHMMVNGVKAFCGMAYDIMRQGGFEK